MFKNSSVKIIAGNIKVVQGSSKRVETHRVVGTMTNSFNIGSKIKVDEEEWVDMDEEKKVVPMSETTVKILDMYFEEMFPSGQRKAAEKAEKATRGKGSKSKDPKAPKRALSAYMFFSQDWRERIKSENPDAGFGEVGKLLGAKWKELDEAEKKPYIEQAARDKTRADEEKAAYDNKKDSGDDEDDEE
ncbi:hypothetical protein CVT24_004976 [Panaeolus cyanescens]|uniref:HMG box domain-containing protein n=1 Tax=Panaeolus cyanescens TaxID=181874 RepID=A0A409V9M6_9AGAR|nr:hypothetical protein CVT24_004976 [Panaeolus cyanescens]